MTQPPITREDIEKVRQRLGSRHMVNEVCDAALAGLESRERQGTIPKKYAKRRQIDEGSYVLVKRDQSNPAEANPNTDWMAVHKIPPQEDQPAEAKCFECNTPLVGPICPACNPEELVEDLGRAAQILGFERYNDLSGRVTKAATTLRQMQAELSALREVIRNISLQRLHLKNTSIWTIIERVFNMADAALAETQGEKV